MMKDKPVISVIVPVKNEANLLNHCLKSLMRLDYPKECLEIIVADGLSSDNTKEVGLSYGVKVVTNEKQIVASGRNCAFKEVNGDLVAFTDADCIFDPCWLKNSIKYFSDEKIGGVGGITLLPPNSSYFEKAIDFLFYLAGIISATSHRQTIPLVKEVKDIPGCNAIYRKEVLDKVLPLDENLLTAEDVWMNFCIRNLGYRLILAPDVVLWHYRRNSPRKFIRQIYRFAIGRLQVGKKNLKLLNPFHILIGIALPFLLAMGVFFYLFSFFFQFLQFILILFLVITLFCWIKTKSIRVAVNLPFVIIIFTFAWSVGFLKELFFPLKEVQGR